MFARRHHVQWELWSIPQLVVGSAIYGKRPMLALALPFSWVPWTNRLLFGCHFSASVTSSVLFPCLFQAVISFLWMAFHLCQIEAAIWPNIWLFKISFFLSGLVEIQQILIIEGLSEGKQGPYVFLMISVTVSHNELTPPVLLDAVAKPGNNSWRFCAVSSSIHCLHFRPPAHGRLAEADVVPEVVHCHVDSSAWFYFCPG